MPKQTDEPRTNQLLVRFTDSQWDVLVALAHLEGVTPNALVCEIVGRRLKRASKDPAIETDIGNRRTYRERRSGQIVPITDRRR